MMTSNIVAILTGERMIGKNTGGRERPSCDESSRRGYDFYEARGRQDGQDIDDWFSAEQQLTNHYR